MTVPGTDMAHSIHEYQPAPQSHFAGREPDVQADLGDAVSPLQSQDHKPDLFLLGWFYTQSTSCVLDYFT